MSRSRLGVTVFTVLISALLIMAAAWPPAADRLPEQSAARTRTPGAAATAVKPTVWAAGTQAAVAKATAEAAKATAAAAATQAAALRKTVTPPAKLPAEEAAAAIQTYAESVLQISVSVTKAGGLTGTVNRALTQTTAGSSAQSLTAKLAVKTYGALLKGGAASLSYGTGTLTGDVTVDVQGSSLGLYTLVLKPAGPLDSAAALQLAQDTFPGLAGLDYQVYRVNKGFAWSAKSTVTGLDLKTRKAVTLAQAVILYVLPGSGGQVSVSATVGRGEFAANLKVP